MISGQEVISGPARAWGQTLSRGERKTKARGTVRPPRVSVFVADVGRVTRGACQGQFEE